MAPSISTGFGGCNPQRVLRTASPYLIDIQSASSAKQIDTACELVFERALCEYPSVSHPLISTLHDQQLLQARLAQLSRRKGLENIFVGLVLKDEQSVAASCDTDTDQVAQHRIPAGCIAKSLTASMLAEAVATRHLGWSDPVCEVLTLSGSAQRKLRGVTVRHLLDHTHGLDASSIEEVPWGSDGFIDVERVCNGLDARPIALPGTLYSYSNAGCWFAGAVLERTYGKSYATLVLEHYGVPAEAAPGTALPDRVCPATGADLVLTLTQWLSFASRHLDDPTGPSTTLAPLRAMQTPLPGWHPSEKGICLGLKYYGGGWFGHNSLLSERTAALRLNPTERIALFVAVESQGAAVLALAGLFGRSLPEFADLKPLRPLEAEQRQGIQYACHVGSYSQARKRLVVGMTNEATLELTCIETSASDRCVPTRIRPTRQGVFIPESTHDEEFPFVQFIAQQDSGGYEYLWNGRQLWRKE